MRGLREGVRLATGGRLGSGILDLFAGECAVIGPGETKLVGTGVALELPEGTEGQIRPETELAREFGVTVLE